jgi:hypothetical protein
VLPRRSYLNSPNPIESKPRHQFNIVPRLQEIRSNGDPKRAMGQRRKAKGKIKCTLLIIHIHTLPTPPRHLFMIFNEPFQMSMTFGLILEGVPNTSSSRWVPRRLCASQSLQLSRRRRILILGTREPKCVRARMHGITANLTASPTRSSVRIRRVFK